MKTRHFRSPTTLRLCILTTVVLLLTTAFPSSATAQTNGQISGIVTNMTTGQPVSQIEITLTAFRTEGIVGEMTTTTSADGAYTFSNVDTADGIVYAASVSYLNVLYSTGMIRFLETSEQTSSIDVFETTDDSSLLRVTSRGIVLSEISPESGEAIMLDIYSIDVEGDQTFVADDNGRSMEFSVPRTAGLVTPMPGFDFGTPTIENAIVFATSPLRPGGGSATLSYPIQYTGTAFSFDTRNAYPTEIMRILIPTDLTQNVDSVGVSAAGFEDAGVAQIGEHQYHVWTASSMERNSNVRVTFNSLPQSAFEPNQLRVLEPAVLAGVALVLATAFTAWVIRRRDLTAPELAYAGSMPQAIIESREELVIQLRELQDEHDNGQIDDELYLSERRTLLERLRIVSRQLRDEPATGPS
jgi:hypothetical protein